MLKIFDGSFTVSRVVSTAMMLLLGSLTSVDPSQANNNRWVPLGPEGGEVSALLVSPSDSTVIYAGLDRGGVFRSTDGGEEWNAMSEGLAVSRVNNFAMFPQDGAPLYAATDRGVYRLPAGSTIWEEASDGLPTFFPYVHEIKIDPSQPEKLYATTAFGLNAGSWSIYRSEDGGHSWVDMSGGLTFDRPILLWHTTPTTLIAGSFQGVHRSTDGGASWQIFTEGLPAHLIFRDFAAHPSDPTTIYAAVRNLLGHGVVPYKSQDGGETWIQASNGLPEHVLRQFSAGVLAIDSGQPDTLLLGTIGGVFRSDDGAESWFPVNGEPADGRIHSLVADVSSGTILAGSAARSGVLRSVDGGATWESLRTGLLGASVFAISPDPVIPDRVIASSELGVLVSDDLGNDWSVAIGGQFGAGGQFVRDLEEPSTVYVLGSNSVYRTTDSGASWHPHGPFFDSNLRSLRLDAASRSFYLTAGGKVWRSFDAGVTWNEISDSICSRDVYLAPPLADGSLVAGCIEDSGLPVSPPALRASILRSQDGGDSWHVVFDWILGSADGGWFFAESTNGGGPLFSAVSSVGVGRFLRSDDFGATWESIELLGDDRVLSVVVDDENPNELWIGTADRGVLRSFDGGDSWQPWNDGLISGRVNSLAKGQNMTEMFWAGTGAGAHVFKPTELCVPSPRTLCLGGRFQAEVSWQDFQGRTGEGIGEPLSSTTGTFWFFNQENTELVVKVLDGRGVNGHHWLFWGGLSNVKYTLTVTDLLSGQPQVIENPIGSLASGGNIRAFPNVQESRSRLRSGVEVMSRPDGEPRASITRKGSGTKSGSQPLLLQDNRFRIEVLWRTAEGTSGTAEGMALTSESGALWFFDPDNLELFVKVLDGRPVNGHFWLFFTGLSNLEFELMVTDTQTGLSRSYHNPQGMFASQVDIKLF